jgi:hypothetical protein
LARNRGEKFDRLQYATPETLYLSPLPCWNDLSQETWRGRALGLIHEIEEETAAHLASTGSQPLGAAAILSKDPHHRPETQKRSPAPLFHAFSAAARRELWEAYRVFVGAFRQAADKLKAGNRDAVFPLGSFPPALPFVGGEPSGISSSTDACLRSCRGRCVPAGLTFYFRGGPNW